MPEEGEHQLHFDPDGDGGAAQLIERAHRPPALEPCHRVVAAVQVDDLLHVCVGREELGFHAAPMQFRAQAGEQGHRAAVDALYRGHLEVERLTARCAALDPAQLPPEQRRIGERQPTAHADLALCGARLHVLDGECRWHLDHLSNFVRTHVWR